MIFPWLAAGRDGFSNFYSVNTQEDVYAHYSPLEVANWQIILTQPEELVFAGARTNIGYVTAMASIIFLIMILYIIIIINSERKNVKISTFASNIRKTLLEVNRDSSKVSKALESVATFAKSRSAFFVDSYSEDYNYIIPSKTKKLLKGEDRKFFISQMFNYISKQRKKRGADIQFIMIKPDLKLRSNMPDFCKFLKENDIKSISIVAIFSNSSNLNVLGVINAKDKQVEILLKDIAICFSIAIYNKKHLLKTESMAITDALTGVANRMAYNRDIKIISERKNNQLTCIYIDVNELNYFNNTYGHAAGDQLLIFVAETLMNEFSDSMIYRMGGDEFLIFTENISKDEILERLTRANHVIEEMKYHVSIGVKSSADDLSIEDIVSEAEKRMYEEKARYYQKSELSKETKLSDNNIRFIKTGIKEVDESLAIMRERYRGVYFVSLTEDKAVQVLAPANYFVVSGEENKFSDILKEYIHDAVKPEFHRTLLNFMQYDVISKQLKNGHVPKLSYTKKDGVKIVLSVHKTVNEADDHTIWMFEAVDE